MIPDLELLFLPAIDDFNTLLNFDGRKGVEDVRVLFYQVVVAIT